MSSSVKLLFALCTICVCVLAIYIRSVESHGSHWRFVATNWSFRAYVLVHKILIFAGIKSKSQECSLELQLMDHLFRTYVKPDYTEHTLSTAKQLLLQTRSGRQGFLRITLPPIWDQAAHQMEYDTIANVKVLWINKHLRSNGIIMSFHGGAYVSGSAESCLPYLVPLTRDTNMSGLSVHYSLSPEVILPQQVNEAFNIYQYLLTEMNMNAKQITLVGDSAGGSLVILLIQKLIKQQEYGDKLPLCAVTLSSWDVPSNGDSYTKNRDTDSLMDDKTGQIWGYFAVGNVDFDGNVVEKDEGVFDRNMNDNEEASYLHLKNLWSFQRFPPLFMSVSQWECVLDDSLRVKQEMDKYKDDGGSECVLHVSKHTGIHVLEDFHAHGIKEAQQALKLEANWILQQKMTQSQSATQ